MRGRSIVDRPQAQQAPGAGGPPSSAPAKRLSTPRWLDVRLILGLVLVAVSVLVGARVVAASDESTTVWAVQHDLAAGTVLHDGDLTKVKVRLYDNAETYLATSTSPAGRMLDRAVTAGELLPKSALADGAGYVTLALSVPAQRVPASLARGQSISVYATSAGPTGAASGDPVNGQSGVVLVAEGLAVADVSGRGGGALTVSTSALQVAVKVPACRVADLIAGTDGRTLSIVVLASPPATRDDPC